MASGKSALQNELIGDIGAEFKALPDGSEDLSLASLGASCENQFTGQPGKQMAALISKLISSKMPAGFNQVVMREHLESFWGLGQGRQSTTICFAVTMAPPSRLENADAAKKFLDSIVHRYGSYAGVLIAPRTEIGSATLPQSIAIVDPASVDFVKKEQRGYFMKQYELLARYLQVENDSAEVNLAGMELDCKSLANKLSTWNSEFDEEFFVGIKPAFDAQKARQYNSWWNWVREDLVNLLCDVYTGRFQLYSPSTDDRFQRILNRWNPACTDLVNFSLSSMASPIKNQFSSSVQELLRLGSLALAKEPLFRYTQPITKPTTTVDTSGAIKYTEIPRVFGDEPKSYSQLVEHGRLIPNSNERIPYIHIRRRRGPEWKYNKESTDVLIRAMTAGTTAGFAFAGKTVLVTGAGRRSIGAEVVQGLLSGGARVIVTTSRTPSAIAQFYNSIYRNFGARGSELIVLPFNQGSKSDCEALIKHIYSKRSIYGEDLDFILPFAAISETGRQIDALDGKAELAHRAMLVNLLRLLGYIKQQKQTQGFDTRPTCVILPLSPNHGTFGSDGLYAESKIGLETLFNRSCSEDWSAYLTICGAVIGWTRGTGLMSGNNIIAEAVESLGAMTFSQSEMAFNILALMTPAVVSMCEDGPVYADLSGGLQFIPDLKEKMVSARKDILDTSMIRKALLAERNHQQSILNGPATEAGVHNAKAPKMHRSSLEVGFPKLLNHKTLISEANDLQGMVDLRRTVVVVGFSELGPWGSSRTRWEMEHMADFTQEGYIEMAWIMGLVRHFDGNLNGSHYVGWVDSKTKDRVQDDEFKRKYSGHILSHSGVRFIEPALIDGYDPEKKEFLNEIAVEEDLPAFEASKATAEAFRLRHGDKVTIRRLPNSEEYQVQLKKGAHFWVPKAVPFDRLVAGQLPSGWDPLNYGIPEDIVSQVDPITLYMLCCLSQALLSAGIDDPFELYKYLHISELANCIGTGVGGLKSMRGVYRDRYLDRPVQNDILQESYQNAHGAWANLLLLASAGPIKSPVGTCATALESLDIGCESIQMGRAKMAFVGGSDDFQEEMSYEFANMKATSNTHDELAKGRLPNEMSRPTTSSRSGFMESAGCGVQIIMNAELALEMGVPIYGIVGYTQMAGDKAGRSVPAPGQGILTAAREAVGGVESPLLDLEYRRRNLRESVIATENWSKIQLEKLSYQHGNSDRLTRAIKNTAACKIRDAQNMWGNDFRRQDPDIAPMRAALAVWGLTVDDIQVASLHGTSTKANDENESDVINKQMIHLGRSKGNPLLSICQKYLTGHPKGAAGAWMLNGCLQVLQTGVVPGNRNADNIDASLQKFEHLMYPTQTIHTAGVKAVMLTSFGFGQKGGLAIVIAPKYFFSALKKGLYDEYCARATKRQGQANRTFTKGMMSNSLFKAKNQSPWALGDETKVFLDPHARVSQDPLEALSFDMKNLHPTANIDGAALNFLYAPTEVPEHDGDSKRNVFSTLSQQWIENDEASQSACTTVGVDVEDVASINMTNEVFLDRNFSPAEKKYCESSPNPQAAFAGRWSAKEAVFKSFQVASRGPGAAMIDIEIQNREDGVPSVKVNNSKSPRAVMLLLEPSACQTEHFQLICKHI